MGGKNVLPTRPPMMARFLLLLAAVLPSLGMRMPVQRVQRSRRHVLVQVSGVAAALSASAAEAKVSEIGSAGLSKEEFYEALASRKEAERVAALPINQLKRARDKFATAPSLVEGGDWNGLRDVIQLTTGPNLSKFLKEGNYQTKEVQALTVKMRKLLFDVDAFAYSQQSFPGSDVFAGYCAEGVVPRETGGCKQKPVVDKPPWIAKLEEAKGIFDDIIKKCDA